MVCPSCDQSGAQTVVFQERPGDAKARGAMPEQRRSPAGNVVGRFLVSALFRSPVEIAEGEFVSIGREKTNDVVFPSAHVSRVHAEVRCENGVVMISDLGSRNGVQVNGARVLKRILADGDRISIGWFDMMLREVRKGGGVPSSALPAETARLSPDHDAYVGDLARIGVVEIAQLLAQNRKTGILTTGDEDGGGALGRLHFLDGSIVHAEHGDLAGEPAVPPVLTTREGKFSFRPTVAIARVTITAPTSRLLFQSIHI
jgi:hypothetical protein